MFNEPFFVAVAFAAFVILVARPITRIITKGLDGRIAKIREELGEATRLRKEAEDALKEYQKKNQKARDEAKEIIAMAKEEADKIIAHAEEEVEKSIEKRTELAIQKIAQAETAVIKEMKDHAVDITISAAKTLIMENLNRDAAEDILTRAIHDIERKFH